MRTTSRAIVRTWVRKRPQPWLPRCMRHFRSQTDKLSRSCQRDSKDSRIRKLDLLAKYLEQLQPWIEDVASNVLSQDSGTASNDPSTYKSFKETVVSSQGCGIVSGVYIGVWDYPDMEEVATWNVPHAPSFHIKLVAPNTATPILILQSAESSRYVYHQ